MLRWFVPVLIAAIPVQTSLVREVRSALSRNDFAAAGRLASAYRAERGPTAELAEAWSWLARDAWNRKDLAVAERYAAETREMALGLLETRALDEDRSLPIALGASIEVQANVMTARGERDQALDFLRQELARWRETSIRARIQKNIHLISLQGKPAPPIPGIVTQGHPVLVFLWAHWCPDCKAMAPVLERIERAYAAKGLLLVAPTQLYGYTKGGEEAGPEEEKKYIREVFGEQYGSVSHMPAPIDGEVFKTYGASTTPTIVLIDRSGMVRLYHPGAMTFEELTAHLDRVVRPLARGAKAN